MELTTAELTVLGLIAERPLHGYEVERVIEQRGIRQWTDIAFSSIYYVISKLQERGLVTAQGSAQGARSRRVFRVTDDGRRAAAVSTKTFISEANPVPMALLVGLANLDLLPALEYLEALRNRLGQIDQRLAAIEAVEQSDEVMPHPAREVFSYSLLLLRAERAWIAERVEKEHD